MKEKNKIKLAMALACAMSFSYTGVVQAADPYYLFYDRTSVNSLLNLDAANQQTLGKGVTVGIIDSGGVGVTVENGKLVPHKEFLNPDGTVKNFDVISFDKVDNHATHVAGIIAAGQNGSGMQGIAPEANIAVGSYIDLQGSVEAMNKNNNIKIINNSWGADIYLDIFQGNIEEYRQMTIRDVRILKTATDAGKLLVFAAGNNGHISAGGHSILPYLEASTKNHFINVINLNANEDNWERVGSGISIKDSAFVHPSSDLGKYVEYCTLAAPGTDIFSTTNTEDDEEDGEKRSNSTQLIDGSLYEKMTGTSMAAPMVTGVGALVQSKFQYMSGKQIADVLFSTANKDISSTQGYMITLQSDEVDEENVLSINVYVLEGGKMPTDAELIAAIEKASGYPDEIKQKYLDILANEKDKVKYLEDVPYEIIFGQGIVDAGKAVNGLGSLNARRLSAADYSNKYNTSGEALYKIDTMGYNSTWSNDISEVRMGDLSDNSQADLEKIYQFYKSQQTPGGANGMTKEEEYIKWYNENVYVKELDNLAVGLWKTGAGELTLSGNNTYQGSNVVDGGLLRIDGSVVGNAFAVSSGAIGGNGTIGGSLSILDKGTVITGNSNTDGTKINYGSSGKSFQAGLTVGKDLNGTNGNYGLATDKNGNGLSLYVKGEADITGGKIVSVAGSVYKPNTNYNIVYAQNITGSFATEGNFTGLLDFAPTMSTKDITVPDELVSEGVSLKVDYNLTDKDDEDDDLFELLENMRAHMEGNHNKFTQAQFDELYALYSLDVNSTDAAFGDLYGGTAMSLASATVRNTFVDKSVQARVVGNIASMELDHDQGNLWFRIGKDWGSVKADSFFDKSNSQSFGVIAGYDKNINKNWLWGGYIAYNSNKLTSTDGTGENHDLRLGTYAKYEKQAFDLLLNLNIGAQNNTTKRELFYAGIGVDGKYKSKTIQFTAKAAYDLNHGKGKAWAIKPYAALNYTHYRQDAYKERADSIFAQQSAGMNLNYLAGELGLDLKRSIKNGTVSFNLGYKRVLSGHDPRVSISMAPLPNYYLQVHGVDYGRDFLTLGTGIELQMKNSWSISLGLDGQFGRNSSNYGAGLNFVKSW